MSEKFVAFAHQMHAAGLADVSIKTFEHYYTQLVNGETGLIPENELEGVERLPNADDLVDYVSVAQAVLPHTAVIKLNGGLGTSMGLDQAKSLLKVKNDLSFLDIIVKQILHLRQTTGYSVPLILMNSFSTHADSLELLGHYPELSSKVGNSFVQNKVPKVLQADYGLPDDDELGWCPPGHGDLYTALHTSGMLDRLLEQGYRYAFVSNADNLGATLDLAILGYFAANDLPFLMEVADRTLADNKGGHLARRKKDARLILREVAQCPPSDLVAFGDTGRYQYFNTNSIWLHLPTLRAVLDANNNVISLPLIRNSKTLDPRDLASPKVYQLETAMGAAIEVFEKAGAIRVPRSRFAPVKLTSDLLVLWSDAYVLTDDYKVVLNEANQYGLPIVQLDPHYYKFVSDLQMRFPEGAPSLVGCESLKITGDFRFGKGVIVSGKVELVNVDPEIRIVGDGAELTNISTAKT